METTKFYSLPKLPYEYKDLEPYISEEQLKIHHSKHHQASLMARMQYLRSSTKHEKRIPP